MTKGLKRVATVAVQILILLAIIIGVAFYNDADSRNTQPGSFETFAETAPATQEATASQPDASNHYAHALESLRVAGRAPKTGYERALFGQAWSDDVTVEFGQIGRAHV